MHIQRSHIRICRCRLQSGSTIMGETKAFLHHAHRGLSVSTSAALTTELQAETGSKREWTLTRSADGRHCHSVDEDGCPGVRQMGGRTPTEAMGGGAVPATLRPPAVVRQLSKVTLDRCSSSRRIIDESFIAARGASGVSGWPASGPASPRAQRPPHHRSRPVHPDETPLSSAHRALREPPGAGRTRRHVAALLEHDVVLPNEAYLRRERRRVRLQRRPRGARA